MRSPSHPSGTGPTRRSLLQGLGALGALGGATALGAGTAAPAAASAASWRHGRPVPPGKIGFGLYSVRDMLAAAPARTLAMLAEAGYAEIEPAYDYGGRSPAGFRRLADANGLEIVGSHHHPYDFRGEAADVTLERAAVLGQEYVGVSYMDGEQTADGYRRMAEEMNSWGAKARQHGLRWYAHLHDNEFHTDPQTGEVLFDVWLAETDPDLVWFEMDLYWILRARTDPRPYLRRFERRFPLLHLKDGDPVAGLETDLGDGVVDFADILGYLRHPAAHHYVIERDEQPDPVRTARRSYDHLRSLRVTRRV
ncbi:sugar phosphate isomerase/epimerase family protein [Vallicoccus soli]|uniref:Sugar phosphate isomerase/epimerase n=1 Tax=Vallicoccus soli TaxID=2339232 RepID=A0A3A3YR05_9ACTN|nr:TIM barrel protein [Vallicoccus soli]RJK93715.1 sugar phosphate isomerase/epimerase [Vallicoccus soli]